MNIFFAVVLIGLESELIDAFPATKLKKILLLWIVAFVVGPLRRSTKWVFLTDCGTGPVDSPDLVGLIDVGHVSFVLGASLCGNAAVVVGVVADAATAAKVKLLFQLEVVPVKPKYGKHVALAVPAAEDVASAVVVFAAYDVSFPASSQFGKEI